MCLMIDHVTIAASQLAAIERAFAEVGLTPDYGGEHSNRVTHMDVLGFDDGSYVELISHLSAGKQGSAWDAFIVGDGGPCAWALGTDDIAGEAARLRALDVPAQGPAPLNRTRPDGRLIEWEQVYLGDGSPGATLPFLIQDKTPRDWRVRPSSSVAGSELRGVAGVVLGVPECASAIDLFRRVFGWPEPARGESATLGAQLAGFDGTPVTLANPNEADSWLALRLERFGPAPCAILLASSDLDATSRRLPLGEPMDWIGRELRWIDPERLHGAHVGVVRE
jgi:hypothetical protein